MSESVVQQDEVSLVPCATCSRTFLPQSLTKHAPICEKTSQKKRKVFNSSKQRVEGTELAQFHQKTYLKRQDSCTKSIKLPNEKSLTSNKPKSLTKLDDVQANLNQINPPKEPNEMPRPTKTPLTTSPNERCPHCGRNFGPKAFDRHVEWCKEHQTRIQKIPTNNPTTLLAKERLEARIKYKVPPLTKTKTILEKYSTTNLHRTASLRQSKNSIVCNTKINKNRDGVKAVKETKRNEESTSNYDPFKSAERQFMELLESDDFKVLTEKTLTRPHTTTSTTIKNDNNNNNNGGKKMTRSAEINSIKRKSVIEPPVNFQDTQSTSFVDDINDEDDDDFETLENLLNGGNIDKLFQQLNRKINNNDKNKRKYSDDISSIDSSLINENDNLSIPEQLILNGDHDDDDIYSPTSTECTDITIKNHDEDRDQDQDLYSIQYDKNIETFIENDKKNQTNCKEIKRKTTKKSNNKNNNNNNNKTTKTTNITKTKSPISTKLQDEDTDVFDIDKETYEEFKIYEEMYLRGKDINNSNNNNNNNNNNIKNNSNNNNNTKKHKIANLSYGIPLMSSSTSSSPATSPQSRKTYNDSAYGSLTRKTDSLSQLDLDVSDTGANSPDHLVGNQKMSKFCHECGSKYPLITAKFCVECGVKRLVL